MKTILSIFLFNLVLFSGCTEDEQHSIHSLTWQPSTFSMPSNLTFSANRFSKGEDEKLYVFGHGYDHSSSEHRQPLLVLDANNSWSMVADLAISYTWNVQVLKDRKIYVSSNEGLYQIEDEGTQLVHGLDGEFINDMEAFNGKLLMYGRMEINQTQASVFSYDGTSFSLMADEPMSAIFLRDINDLFVRLGDNLYQYDGSNLNLVKEPDNTIILKIRNGEFYSLDQVNGHYRIIKEDVSGKKKKLGDPFPSNVNISQICFLENIPVAIGTDNDTGLSVAYFFQNDKWHSIPTIVRLNNIIEYEGKILATTYDNPRIIEVTKK